MKQICQLILLSLVIAFGVYVFKSAIRVSAPHNNSQLAEIINASS